MEALDPLDPYLRLVGILVDRTNQAVTATLATRRSGATLRTRGYLRRSVEASDIPENVRPRDPDALTVFIERNGDIGCGFQLKRAAIALVDEHPSATMIYFSDDDGGVLRLDWHDEGA